MKSYQDLIENKIVLAKQSGMTITDADINLMLFDFDEKKMAV